jgi:hypothetical protein
MQRNCSCLSIVAGVTDVDTVCTLLLLLHLYRQEPQGSEGPQSRTDQGDNTLHSTCSFHVQYNTSSV